MPTNSTLVFPPGFRVTDSSGRPVSGAKIKFYNAGGLVSRTVYSDSGLSSSLGSTVYCGSDGFPVASSGSSTPVNVYIGTAAYKVIITTSGDVAIQTLDNRIGALDTSTFLTSSSTSTLSIPVVTKTGNFTISTTERGKLIQGNASGGNFTLTLDAAATLGDGWNGEVRNSGTSGQVILAASQAIAFEGQTFTARALEVGEAMTIRCDGTAFKVVGHTPPLMAWRGGRILIITDRVTADPVSPTPGARYIVTASYGSYATHDVIEANGSSFNKYTPASDSGWLAYVQDEDTYYSFQGSAWVSTKATQAEAQAGTSDIPFMTPLRTRQSLPARGYGEYTTASADLSGSIPVDDTIPQSNEGDQIVTATITLNRSDSRVRATFNGWGGSTTDTPTGVVAIFYDGSANALNAKAQKADSDGGAVNYYNLDIAVEHAPGSVGPFTYQVRTGFGTTYRINGGTGARLFGGASRATLVLQEVFV